MEDKDIPVYAELLKEIVKKIETRFSL